MTLSSAVGSGSTSLSDFFPGNSKKEKKGWCMISRLPRNWGMDASISNNYMGGRHTGSLFSTLGSYSSTETIVESAEV